MEILKDKSLCFQQYKGIFEISKKLRAMRIFTKYFQNWREWVFPDNQMWLGFYSKVKVGREKKNLPTSSNLWAFGFHKWDYTQYNPIMTCHTCGIWAVGCSLKSKILPRSHEGMQNDHIRWDLSDCGACLSHLWILTHSQRSKWVMDACNQINCIKSMSLTFVRN